MTSNFIFFRSHFQFSFFLISRLPCLDYLLVFSLFFFRDMESFRLSLNVESLLSIPTDVLEHHIFKYFDTPILLVCSHVCSQLRKHSSRRLCELPHLKRHQNTILLEIFRNGWTDLLSWFQALLRYPSIASLSELRSALLEQCLSSCQSCQRQFSFILEPLKLLLASGSSTC